MNKGREHKEIKASFLLHRKKAVQTIKKSIQYHNKFTAIFQDGGDLAFHGEVRHHHFYAVTESGTVTWKEEKWRSRIMRGLGFMMKNGIWYEG